MISILTGTYSVLDLDSMTGSGPVELDMGCGKGRFTLELASRYPDRFVLGSDIMLGRLRKVARKAERRSLSNLRLLRCGSLELVAFLLPPRSIDRIHLLCPDPWPKERHRMKRLVTTDFISRLPRVLKPGGVLHMSTDHLPYLEDWKRIVPLIPGMHEDPQSIADVVSIQTDFEIQWRAAGKDVPHLGFRLENPPKPNS